MAFSDSRPDKIAMNETKYGLMGASPPSLVASAMTGTPALRHDEDHKRGDRTDAHAQKITARTFDPVLDEEGMRDLKRAAQHAHQYDEKQRENVGLGRHELVVDPAEQPGARLKFV